jgi:hypothetical protein
MNVILSSNKKDYFPVCHLDSDQNILFLTCYRTLSVSISGSVTYNNV